VERLTSLGREDDSSCPSSSGSACWGVLLRSINVCGN
jgi:hypothetical protein